ncbi:MAG TPA: hypothetical protein VFB50_22650, partial [Chloroflexota bacterium]|nr:hypothetical protein [Chloroflexota bacterium]
KLHVLSAAHQQCSRVLAVIDLQEYTDAGFTPSQARLLMARDRRIEDRLAMLHDGMTRGVADILVSIQALTDAMDTRFDGIESALRRGGRN